MFDKQTLLVIYDFMTAGYVDSVHFTISTGKEGNVFYVTDENDDPFALKIFRTSTSTFKRVSKYIEGDPRFKGITGNRRKLIYAWTNKEFRNLQRYELNKIRVPSPIEFEKNCLLMEYVGDKNGPAPQLREAELKKPNTIYKECVKFIVDGFKKAHLVHGDLSEYNILIWKDKPVLIDCGQALTADHFNAKEFLERDIKNINRYFKHRDDVDIIDDREILAKALENEE